MTYETELESWQCGVSCGYRTGISVRVYADGAQDSTVQPPSNQHVIAFLLQSADWYRHMLAERQIATDPADLILRAK